MCLFFFFFFFFLFFVFVTLSLVLYLLLHLSSLMLFAVDLLIFCILCVVIIVMSCSSSSDTKITVVSQLLELSHTCCQSNLPWMSQLCAVCCLRRVLCCESYGREIPLTHSFAHYLQLLCAPLFFCFLIFLFLTHSLTCSVLVVALVITEIACC